MEAVSRKDMTDRFGRLLRESNFLGDVTVPDLAPVLATNASIGAEVARLQTGQSARFPGSSDLLPELLLSAQEHRFTGCVVLEAPAEDRLLYHEGVLVAVEQQGNGGCRALAEALQRYDADSGGLEVSSPDAVIMGRRLLRRGLDEQTLERASSLRGRMRLLWLASECTPSRFELFAGLTALAHFLPGVVDPRPAIAFGTVMFGSGNQALYRSLVGRDLRLISTYDAARNPLGLPPPLIGVLHKWGQEPRGRFRLRDKGAFGLSPPVAGGLISLLHRLGLVEICPQALKRKIVQ